MADTTDITTTTDIAIPAGISDAIKKAVPAAAATATDIATAAAVTTAAAAAESCPDFSSMIPENSPMHFKYIRIQGAERAENTNVGKGIFSMCWSLIQKGEMLEEDEELYREIDSWIAEDLPYPEVCNRQEPCICFFKAENTESLRKKIIPAMWLLDKYNHPYYVVHTNYPGRIIYEDEYQVVADVSHMIAIEKQKSWT